MGGICCWKDQPVNTQDELHVAVNQHPHQQQPRPKKSSQIQMPKQSMSKEQDINDQIKNYQKDIQEQKKVLLQMQYHLASLTQINKNLEAQNKNKKKLLDNMISQRNTIQSQINKQQDKLRKIGFRRQELLTRPNPEEPQHLQAKLKLQSQINDKIYKLQLLSQEQEKLNKQRVYLRQKEHQNKIFKEQMTLKIKQTQGKINSLTVKVEDKKKIYNIKKQHLSDLQKQSSRAYQQSNIIQKQISNMKDYLKQQHQKHKQNIKIKQRQYIQQNNIKKYFPGDILLHDDDYKEYLLTSLQTKLNTKIKNTRLIYKWDPKSKVNLHKYIDFVPNLVVIIKLNNGYIVAAWSQGGFAPKTASDKDGLLFSLTNRRMFQLNKANHRAITYDEFFIIFGNSQLRIKSGETKVFSNFGISTAYYNNRGQKIDILLGAGKQREIQLIDYEVYQLKMN